MRRILLFMCVATILAIGLVMIFSTTSADALEQDLVKNGHQPFLKQVLYAAVGCFLAAFAYNIGYRRVIQASPYLLAFFTFLLLLALIPGIGREINGSRRWLNLAGISLQPSEFIKYVVPAYFVYFLSLKKVEGERLCFGIFCRLMLMLAVPILLILLEPNNGTAAVIGAVIAVLCAIMHVPLRFWALPLALLACVGIIFATHTPYVSARLKVYLHPELDLKGKGHQPYQAKIAVGSGGLLGKGPGNSLQKLSYLPEAQNDYIGAIYAEEFGFIGILALITLYMLLATISFVIACGSEDKEGLYFGGAIAFLMAFQAFLNLGVVSGLLPSTGLNLPFFSQGGSSLMANLLAIGLLASVGRPLLSLDDTRS